MRRILALLALAIFASVVLTPAHAQKDASRILDRTFACQTGYLGGVYQADVDSYWYVDPKSNRRSPSATVSTNLEDGFLGGISSTSMYVNRVHCKAVKTKVRLTAGGLTGGAFTALGEEYQCFTPRRVLLRFRGEFLRPTAFKTASPTGYPQLQALGATKRTELAVATLKGKPIAYAATAGSKRARLFTSVDCRSD